MLLQPFYIDKIITTALEEDIHYVDVTTDYLLDDEHTSEAYYLAKDTGVLCGIDIAKRVFELAGGNVTMEILKKDGETVQKGDILARMKGSTKTLLKGERTALNLLQHMSGIATATAECVALVAGTRAQITDTRKTLPGLRQLQKYAVTVGGGKNHRYNLSDGAMQMEVQVDSDTRTIERQTTTIYSQFEATKASIIDQLNIECEQYKEQLEKCAIVSSVDGKVSDISVVQGSAVNQGSELIKVQQGNSEDNVIVCYVSLNSGKKITKGMEVLVYPTTVNKQEYGHMTATVVNVDNYVTSTESLRTQLGNDTLVETFLNDGPVIAVTCELKEDDNTSSGYYWSSSKGKDVMLLEGTLVEASVVLEEKAPITMLIPYIKEKLTIKTDTNAQ